MLICWQVLDNLILNFLDIVWHVSKVNNILPVQISLGSFPHLTTKAVGSSSSKTAITIVKQMPERQLIGNLLISYRRFSFILIDSSEMRGTKGITSL